MTIWNKEGIPHRGWNLEYVHDVRENGESVEEAEYETCMMCNNPKIRYVHVLSHPEIDYEFRVGCQCSETMTGDYVNPQKREKELRKKASQRTNFIKKNWKLSSKGNRYLKKDGHILVIFEDNKTHKYRCSIDNTFGKKSFDTLAAAKNALFSGIEHFKKNGKW